jgi:general secretion pathway protein A
MYERFFGFNERPFELTANPAYLVLTPSHQEALSNLEYAIGGRKPITLLTGEAGSGKTTLIRAALKRQPASVHGVHVHNPTLTRAEFVQTMAALFGLSNEAAASKAVLLAELKDLLQRRREQSELTVLVIDEAQSLPSELLEEIRLLVNLETDEEKLLSVVLAGQPELVVRLNQTELRQLKQRIALRCELRPLTLPETAAYLAGRIQAAGGVGAQVFTREAVAVIAEQSGGIPRVVNVIADNALLGSFAAGERPVTSQTVRDVCRDFHFGDVAEPVPAPPPDAATSIGILDARRGHRVLAVDGSAQPEPSDRRPGASTDQAPAAAPKRRSFSLFGSGGLS